MVKHILPAAREHAVIHATYSMHHNMLSSQISYHVIVVTAKHRKSEQADSFRRSDQLWR